MIEYRVTWCASSNITFNGESDWMEWDDPDATEAEVEEALSTTIGPICMPDGLDIVLEACGFEWGIETREAS